MGGCQGVAVLWLLLGCCGWLPGCCYVVAVVRLLWVVAILWIPCFE